MNQSHSSDQQKPPDIPTTFTEDVRDINEGNLDQNQTTRARKKHRPDLKRGAAACSTCRGVKMKCIGGDPSRGIACQRCSVGSRKCIYRSLRRGRKPKSRSVDVAEGYFEGEGSSTGAKPQNDVGRWAAALEVNDETGYNPPYNATALTSSIMDQHGYHEANIQNFRQPEQRDLNLVPNMAQDLEADMSGWLPTAMAYRTVSIHSANPLGLLLEATQAYAPCSSDRSHPTSPPTADEILLLEPTVPAVDRSTIDISGVSDPASLPKDRHTSLVDAADASFRLYQRSTTSRLLEIEEILSNANIEYLLAQYFQSFHASTPFLCPELHSMQRLRARSELLLTVLCTTASRLQKDHTLFNRLSCLTIRLVGRALANGQRSIETIQAFLLLTTWPLDSTGQQEYSRTWHMLGLALRMATDLNLFATLPAHNDIDHPASRLACLERADRERCWLMCFILDRSISIQLGKPWTLPETELIRTSFQSAWYDRPYSQCYDMPLSAYVQMYRCLSKTLEQLSWNGPNELIGFTRSLNHILVVESFETEITAISQKSRAAALSIPTSRDRVSMEKALRYTEAYASLMVNSHALVQAVQQDETIATLSMIPKMYTFAMEALQACTEQLDASFHSVNEGQALITSYVALSLIKLLDLRYPIILNRTFDVLATCLGIAERLHARGLDAKHGPRLYGGLLRKAIVNKLNTLEGIRLAEQVPKMMQVPDDADHSLDSLGNAARDLSQSEAVVEPLSSALETRDSGDSGDVRPSTSPLVRDAVDEVIINFSGFLEADLDIGQDWTDNAVLLSLFDPDQVNFGGS